MKKLFNPSRIITFCAAFITLGTVGISLEGCKKETKSLLVQNQGFLSCKVHYYQHIYNNGTDTTNSLMAGAGASFIDANGNTLSAGSVSINGTTMENTDVLGQYNYGLSNQAEDFFSGGSVFAITGSDQIKSFSHDAGALVPFRMTLPYTMVKANGISFTVNIPSTFSYSEIRVTIGDKDDNRVYETFNTNNINIPAAAFSGLSTIDGENSYILVEVVRKQTVDINGEEVNFIQSVLEQHPIDLQ
jgi:hypothetical protein